jgi:predicted metal-dependent hydrolase
MQQIEIKYEKRKTLALTIGKTGTVIIKAPLGLKTETIYNFIEQKQRWINEKLHARLLIEEKYHSVMDYTHALYLGNMFPVILNLTKVTQIKDNALSVCVKIAKDDKDLNAKVIAGIKRWLRSRAKEYIEGRLIYIAAHTGLKYKSYKLVNTRGRWGACKSNGELNFNWRLIMMPPLIIDYLIVHELSHLKHMNHSKQFWQLVESIIPDFAELRKTLKELSFITDLFR